MSHERGPSLALRSLGNTGLRVSAVGLGAGPLGDLDNDDRAMVALVEGALERGVTLFDTAPSYGASEERLGRALRGKRERAVLATKGIYGVPGAPDWRPETLALALDRSLERLGTDHVDVFFLHSCDAPTMDSLWEALAAEKRRGRVRAIGYSGDGAPLLHAIASGAVDVIECSVSLFDQAALSAAIPEASRRGLGVLAKRALANAPWRESSRPARDDVAIYWERMRAMLPEPLPSISYEELALRFATFAPGVSAALVGTRSLEHLDGALALAARGPLPSDLTTEVERRFAAHGAAWPGVV